MIHTEEEFRRFDFQSAEIERITASMRAMLNEALFGTDAEARVRALRASVLNEPEKPAAIVGLSEILP